MSTFRFLGVAVVLAVAGVTPASAQAVIQEPGYCAFFYPNANCQNKGPGNPYTDPNFYRGQGQGAGTWAGGQTVGVAPNQPRKPRSAATRSQ